jgi:hypothetical protein
MSFGRRRFQALVQVGDGEHARMEAYFLPTDNLSAKAEVVAEDALRAAVADAPHLHVPEEYLALKAFDQFHRGKKGSRATAEAAVARRGQASIVDPLEPQERQLVERWRTRVTTKVTTLPDDDTLRDLTRRILTEILDVYLPKGK